MPNILLVTRSAALATRVKRLRETLPDLSFHLSGTLAEAQNLVQRDDFLAAVVHAACDADHAAIVEFLQRIAGACPTLILADSCRDHQALALFRAGAEDYLGMPLDAGKLTFLLDVLSLRARPPVKPVPPPANAALGRPDAFFHVVAPQTDEMMEQVRRVAPQETTLLFTGETGTGKIRLARLIHDLSPRHAQPFVVMDCAALSTSLIEREMFGHVRGALTGADSHRQGKFATAGAGTVVLDEIDALPLPLQCKLLRVVDERMFEPVGSNQPVPLRARLMAVSNAALDQEVLAGKFRSDLYSRISAVGFYLPPLRARQTAIAPLCHEFLAEFADTHSRHITGMAPGVLETLEAYHWPGNVRELRNVIERAVALAKGPLVMLDDLPPLICSSHERMTTIDSEPQLVPAEGTLKEHASRRPLVFHR